MSPADRRLAAVAAALAGGRAASLLARLGSPGAEQVAALAARLAAAPRDARLRALAAELGIDPRVRRAVAEAAAPLERTRVGRALSAIGRGGGGEGIAPTLLRLCREKLAG